MVCIPSLIHAQTPRTVTGKVTDPAGGALIGVSIAVKGTAIGTTTDASGQYKITLPDGKGTLIVSFLGYLKQEIPVTGNRHNVVLKEDPRALEEVVVVGYGTQKRTDVTGSISSISSKKIQEVPVSNAAAALQGRVAGVLVDKGGNRPGDGVRVQIRGRRSFSASNDPLYVVDGIPIDATINDLDPDDIETMEVLKDASAAAIYGSRGANGVVIITTRRGKAGKINVRYSGYLGRDEAIKVEQRMNAAEFVEYRREAKRMQYPDKYPAGSFTFADDIRLFGEYASDYYTLENLKAAWAGGTYDPSKLQSTDWSSFALRKGASQDHHISVTAGNEMTKVLFSTGYQRQTGIIYGQDFLRWDARLTVDQQITKGIKIGMVNYFSHSRQQYGSNLFENSATSNPVSPAYDSLGIPIAIPSNDTQVFSILYDREGITRERRRSRYLGSFYGEVKLPLNFRYRLNVGIDFAPYREGEFQSAASTPRKMGTSWGRVSNEDRFNYNVQNLLYWNSDFSKIHNIGLTLLQEVQGYRTETSEIRASDFPYEHQKWFNLATAVTTEAMSSRLTQRQLASFMGRVNYSYAGKYLLTASLRADGSSVLAEGHKWAYFPSLALAWRLSEEKFLKGNNIVNDLKLRLGWGKTGNAAVGAYGTKGALALTRYVWNNSGKDQVANGFRPDVIPNPDLSWENTATYNAGLEFGLFKGRIGGTLELYRQRTTNLLLNRQLPRASGFDDITQNVGVTMNKGLEVTLNTVNIDKRDFRWTTDITFTSNREQIVELYNGAKDDIGNSWFIGQPISVIYRQRAIGIWQNTREDIDLLTKYNTNGGTKFAPGKIKIDDINSDGKINEQDRVILGSQTPRWIGSISNTFTYKGWDLSFFLITRQRYVLENNLGLSFQGRYNTAKVDYWTPDNPNGRYPRPNGGLEGPEYITSMYVEDASHVRLRNVSIGYKLPAKLTRKAGISGFRVYATGTNLYVWAPHFTGTDPEVFNDDNSRPVRSPSVRSFILGVNVEF